MRWIWTLLFALVLTILVVEVTGFFLPARTDVEQSVAVEAPREEIFALLEDFETWPAWAELLRDGEDELFRPIYGEVSRGLGAQMRVRYDGANQVLFTIVEHESPARLSLNTRSGRSEAELLAGEGFEAWDDIELETLDEGRTRVTWRRRGSELESYWLRFFDRFVLRSQLEDALLRAVERLRDHVEGRG